MKMQRKIFGSFLIMIAIPTLAFLVIIIQISTRIIEQRTISAGELVVKESVKRVDTLLNNYRKASMQIYFNENVMDFLGKISEGGPTEDSEQEVVNDVLGSIVNADRYLMTAAIESGGMMILRGTRILGIEGYFEQCRKRCAEFPGRIVWIPSRKMSSVFGLDSHYFGAARLIRKNDCEIGILVFLIREEFFNDIYAGAVPDGSGNDYILAPDGAVVSGPPGTIGEERVEDRFMDIVSGDNGRNGFRRVVSGGRSIYQIFARSDESGWYFIREMDEKTILYDIISLKRSLIAIILLFCSFLVFLSYMLSRGLSRPVCELVSCIDGIGGDNLDVPMPTGGPAVDEISRLQERLSVMSDRIRVLINEVACNERMKIQAELQALRNHISPHFIYNALDTIRWMAVLNSQDNIRDMVCALDKLMRYAADSDKVLITLDEELEIIREYVFIQRMRFSDMELETDIPDETGAVLVNKFILQTIVENSIIHGFRDFHGTGKIVISAGIEGGDMVLTVKDNGKGFLPDADSGDERPHTGIATVNRRLMLNYGPGYGVRLDSIPGIGTTAVLRLPVTEERSGKQCCNC